MIKLNGMNKQKLIRIFCIHGITNYVCTAKKEMLTLTNVIEIFLIHHDHSSPTHINIPEKKKKKIVQFFLKLTKFCNL